jgi:hypothetical protein
MTVQIKDRYLSTLYRNLYAQWERSNQLGREQEAQSRFFPSTWESSRGPCSPLGGQAVEQSKKEQR